MTDPDAPLPGVVSIDTLRDALRRFAAERDWDKFHSPKNLAMALAVEASELLEHFQWLTEEESKQLTAEKLQQVSEELADVLNYLIRLSDKLGVDVLAAAQRKIAINADKYPVDKVRGSSRKYTEWPI
jgi:NTP pyrophosphatase (non-canonical NTP hydrolase)